MSVSAEGEIRPQTAVPAVEEVVPVSQQQPEGIVIGAVDLLCQPAWCFLVGVAVGVVDPGDEDGVPVPFQRDEFVAQYGDARFPQSRLDLLHHGVAVGPFVVAGDIVGGGNGAEGRTHAPGVGNRLRRIFVHQIAGEEDHIRRGVFHGLVQFCVVLPEFPVVQVAELHDPQPVERGGQGRGGIGHGIRFDVRVAPVHKQRQRGQHQKPTHQSAERGTGSAALCHGKPPYQPADFTTYYYITGFPGRREKSAKSGRFFSRPAPNAGSLR